ncbi:sulfite exporter TauE/SafE family protein [Paenibacillus validus]|uniref:sulfite exporter TauE/SafE family protein n=1 Tax=Paenibacillus TaxID=44249 RepID=UPI000FDB5022|nr:MULTISPECIES: sulfite exporter TauE/SafE family protein [Paenibacillus]MED4602600.1 sulfite exporter TauE/SafE family protein [Paenibacillus validus]MED4607882.1 sulfite exporter TauE/SafE family protein [Paenibacillus validus]
MSFLFFTAVGLIAATFGSLVGLGGGIIIVPALVYLGPLFVGQTISVSTAVGTSLAVLIFTALSSTLAFLKQKRVDFRSGLLYFMTCGPAAMLGSYVTQFVDAQSFQLYFGFFMMFMAILLILRDYIKPINVRWSVQRTYIDASGQTFEYGYSLIPALAIGSAVGFISGLFGIGGGSLFVPAMVLLFRYPPHVATATSMFVILLSSVMGTVTKLSLGEVDLWMVLCLAPTAVLGGWLGAQIASRLSSKKLLWVLRISFVLIASKMILEGLNII